MSRYNTTPNLRDKTGKRKKATTILPVVPTSGADITIVTTSPDRLDKLAYTFYDDASLWWVIAAVNGLGKGTFVVPSNTTIRIPSKSGIQDLIVQINESR
tara:strand:- start:41 stop:340 length:300 start_codon:yes stop_codon:yes gene_type:complete